MSRQLDATSKMDGYVLNGGAVRTCWGKRRGTDVRLKPALPGQRVCRPADQRRRAL